MGVASYDVETAPEKGYYVDETGAVPGESFGIGTGFFARLQRLAGKLSIEERGIERIPETERTDTNLRKVGTVWLAANMVVSSFAIGALAYPVFQLGFVDACLTILFINLLAITPVCYFSTFGPRFGLRQMVLSRFYFGFQGVKIVAFFNILACVGWSSVNVIVGAQLLHAVNADLPGFAGIIVIAAATLIVTTFGYKVVHYYEGWSWIPCFIIFLIVLGEFAHSENFSNLPMGSGPTEAGAVLSFSSAVFGFGTGWTSLAADYSVYQPVNVSRTKVFFWTWIGLIFPLLFTEMLGAAIQTASANNAFFAESYKKDHIGGLLAAVLVPPLGRFGQFCLVVLALSIIANNCPNMYSVGLSLQLMAEWTHRVPRFVWTFAGTLAYCAIAIPGYSHFETVLENFMLLIAYWLAIYEGIALSEHFFFRKGMNGYAPETYMDAKKLPPGIAAVTAFCFGVFGAVMGMAQVWFIGPIGKRIGNPKFGGDVGFPLAFAFAAISYTALRTIEYRHFRR
ncbi:MAG: purine-cytosine permease [Caeruleum heppii]|nr:MAG: purine-cytosine permease [Caeruleum heppii]